MFSTCIWHFKAADLLQVFIEQPSLPFFLLTNLHQHALVLTNILTCNPLKDNVLPAEQAAYLATSAWSRFNLLSFLHNQRRAKIKNIYRFKPIKV